MSSNTNPPCRIPIEQTGRDFRRYMAKYHLKEAYRLRRHYPNSAAHHVASFLVWNGLKRQAA